MRGETSAADSATQEPSCAFGNQGDSALSSASHCLENPGANQTDRHEHRDREYSEQYRI
jgi:hypothetical protein